MEGTARHRADAHYVRRTAGLVRLKARAVQKTPERLAEEIHGCYPFHPRFADLVATFRNKEGFRQTRGLLSLAGRIVRGVWLRPTNDVHLIGVQHADLSDSTLRSEPFLEPMCEAIAHDITNQGQAMAETIDATQGSDAGSQVAVAPSSAPPSAAVAF